MGKEMALEIINELPDTVSIRDIIESLYIRMKVEQGLNDVKEGKLISHEELKKELAEWK